jgi:hypothetical protein
MNVSALTNLTSALPAGGAAPALSTVAAPATAARDAAMADYATDAAGTNSLQTMAALLAGQNPNTSAFDSSGSSALAGAGDVAIAAPPLPSAVDHGSHDESPIHEDLGLADDASADPSQASISV